MAPRANAKNAKANGIGHNGGGPTREERERAFLIGMDACRKARAATEEAKSGLRAIRKRENEVRNAMKRDQFSLKVVDEILADEAKTRADIEGYEELRRFMRESVGLAVGGQVDLFAALDDTPRDADWWYKDGYQAGMAGKECKLPAGIPPEHQQSWQKGWGAAQEKIAWTLAEKGVNPDKAPSDVEAARARADA